MELLTPFVALVPLQYIIVLMIAIGITHILKIIAGNAIVAVRRDVRSWTTFSLLASILSGFGSAYIAALEIPEIFVVTPIMLGAIYSVVTPLVGALLIHSDKKLFAGLRTQYDNKLNKR